MKLQFNALTANRTWDLVDHLPSDNVIDSLLVFKIKHRWDWNLKRFKARIMANGGLDVSIRLVLTIVITRGWQVSQLNIGNAFLNGSLNERIIMHQPVGFIDSQNPNKVCLLCKAVYDLK